LVQLPQFSGTWVILVSYTIVLFIFPFPLFKELTLGLISSTETGDSLPSTPALTIAILFMVTSTPLRGIGTKVILSYLVIDEANVSGRDLTNLAKLILYNGHSD
jgi:hypothetical protein